ncbi:transmembrane protein 216-like [Tubulanus polymorphus]|uniref:transmembrane protein 216-like n=1 Tax=Tubulanus polymorphus TaxID=672921 RepID=UPI003DA663C4
MAGAKSGKSQVIRSSLPYQVLLVCNAWYLAFFTIAEILIFIYKGEILPFATNVLPAEVVLLLIWTIIEAMRIFLGQKGNLTERMITVVLSIVMLVPSVLGVVFLIIWQTYVLRIDVILCAIEFVFLGLELIFGIISLVTFARAAPY